MQTPHRLPELPFSADALAPFLSAEILEYHAGYAEELNSPVSGTEFAGAPLEEAVRRSSGAIYANAARHFDHGSCWNRLAPSHEDGPTAGL